MNRVRLIITLNTLMILVLLFGAAGARAQGPAPLGMPAGPAFTYQGQLKKSGKPFSGACDFQFNLYDSAAGGRQIGVMLASNGVKVTEGVFSVKLDFGSGAFTGEARWLQVAVKCPGDPGFVIFNTRQELTPAPYAIGLAPGAVISAAAGDSVTGKSDTGRGLVGFSRDNAGVVGESSTFDGVWGRSTHAGSAGVSGRNETPEGGFGVWGYNKGPNGHAVFGLSEQGVGVTGITRVDNRSAVLGSNEAGGSGVEGASIRGAGVYGHSGSWAGIYGESATFEGVHGQTSGVAAGVAGVNTGAGPGLWGTSVDGTGVYGKSNTGYAGWFDGKVHVNVLEIAGGADLAEPFDITGADNAAIVPGTVVCIDPANPGKLVVCASAYDRTVAGVISGAGGIQPGMVMHQGGSAANGRYPVALSGRVYVWADATQQPIRPGDLLTTSTTPGYAARASNHDQAQGAIIGKAMGALGRGKGLVLVLVGLN